MFVATNRLKIQSRHGVEAPATLGVEIPLLPPLAKGDLKSSLLLGSVLTGPGILSKDNWHVINRSRRG